MGRNQRTYESIKQQIYELASHPFFSDFNNIEKESTELTEPEKEARRQWNIRLDRLIEEILTSNRENAFQTENSLELLMESACLPPNFAEDKASARSFWNEYRSKRQYPPSVHDWNAFLTLVNDFAVPAEWSMSIDMYMRSRADNHIMHCIHAMEEQRSENESRELQYLERVVWNKLALFGCMKTETVLENGREIIKQGRPDYFSVRGNGLSVVIEVKASHNLLLPNDVNNIITRYLQGFQEHNKNWSHIGHPLAQILAYMIDNDCRYGALCSASKTYFLHIEGSQCKITRAWITCEEHFLKAWMAFLKAAKDNYNSPTPFDTKPPMAWEANTPLHDTSQPTGRGGHGDEEGGGQDNGRKRKRKGSLRRSPRNHEGSKRYDDSSSDDSSTVALAPPFYRWETPEMQEDLLDFELEFVEVVPQSELNFVSVLGEGKNGQVLKTLWKGTTVAVKQFDLSKRGFAAYKNEVQAYKFLRGAWGRHVPTPLFISRSKSGQVAFLGMTIGKEISDEDIRDNGYWNRFVEQVGILERDFNFCHLDVWESPRVLNFIVDENENVLVIDLEVWERKDEGENEE